jgi:hypothetical protein
MGWAGGNAGGRFLADFAGLNLPIDKICQVRLGARENFFGSVFDIERACVVHRLSILFVLGFHWRPALPEHPFAAWHSILSGKQIRN